MKGDPITERGIRYLLNDVVKRTAGVTEIHPHKLRHTFATFIESRCRPKNSSIFIRHVNLSTTGKYTHVSNQQLRKVYLNASSSKRRVNK